MGKPYSLDLRKRVVAAIEGGMSCNQAAKQFGVRSARQSAGCSGSRRPAALRLARWAVTSRRRFRASTRSGCRSGSRDGDFTLRGLVAELAGRGLKVDYRSVWEFVHAEKLSFKKKRGGWRTRSSRRGAAASPVDKVSRSRRT